jgi:hypothetical protein
MRSVKALACVLTTACFAIIPGSICAVIPILALLGAFGLGASRNAPEGAESETGATVVAFGVSAFIGAMINLVILFLFASKR